MRTAWGEQGSGIDISSSPTGTMEAAAAAARLGPQADACAQAAMRARMLCSAAPKVPLTPPLTWMCPAMQ